MTARWAIVEPVTAQADVDLSLAGAAVLFAIALFFCHVALHALILGLGDGGHRRTLARVEGAGKVPLVTRTVVAPASRRLSGGRPALPSGRPEAGATKFAKKSAKKRTQLKLGHCP